MTYCFTIFEAFAWVNHALFFRLTVLVELDGEEGCKYSLLVLDDEGLLFSVADTTDELVTIVVSEILAVLLLEQGPK
jgi:hypothetical protein